MKTFIKKFEKRRKRVEKTFQRDFYFDDVIYRDYLLGKRGGIHFNSASLAAPFPAARKEAQKIFQREKTLSSVEKRHIISKARTYAAQLINLSDVRGVAFGRNTTEAASFVYWLAGLKAGDKVVLTDGEHASIRRLFEMHLDHGNPQKRDGWSAWPTWYSARGPTYDSIPARSTGVQTATVAVTAVAWEQFEQEMKKQIDKQTRVFVFSHVLRDSGRELPAKRIITLARKIKAEKNPQSPNLFVLVDGAQALGNLPQVDFADLGCDAYVATPHKTMKSEVVGLLYFNPENPRIRNNLRRLNTLRCDDQVILNGSFDPRLGIKANVADSISYADIAGFLRAFVCFKKFGLRDNDFSKISKARQVIKDYLLNQMQSAGIKVDVPTIDSPTAFIVSFRLKGRNKKEIAKQMSNRGMFMSFIHNPRNPRLGCYRASFQPDNTREEVDGFVSSLKEVLTSNGSYRSAQCVSPKSHNRNSQNDSISSLFFASKILPSPLWRWEGWEVLLTLSALLIKKS